MPCAGTSVSKIASFHPIAGTDCRLRPPRAGVVSQDALQVPSFGQMISTIFPRWKTSMCSSGSESAMRCGRRWLSAFISRTVRSKKCDWCPQSHSKDDGKISRAINTSPQLADANMANTERPRSSAAPTLSPFCRPSQQAPKRAIDSGPVLGDFTRLISGRHCAPRTRGDTSLRLLSLARSHRDSVLRVRKRLFRREYDREAAS